MPQAMQPAARAGRTRAFRHRVRRAAIAAGLLFGGGTAAVASAFCGFFVSGADASLVNNASQVAILRKGNRTALTMSNNYKGPPEDFAMVVPVPVVLQQEQVKTLSPDVFSHVDQLSAPRLVEYWEQDPCYVPPTYLKRGGKGRMRLESSREYVEEKEGGSHGVKIEAKFEVGEYQILILSAKESTGLETWLRQNKYRIPSGASAALAPYVRDQMKLTVRDGARVGAARGRGRAEQARNGARAYGARTSTETDDAGIV